MFTDNKDRKVIPRWRDFATTTALGELSSPTASRKEAEQDAREHASLLYRQWKDHPTIWYAADVLSSAVVLGLEETVRDVAQFVHENSERAPHYLASIARRIFETGRGSNVVELPKPSEDSTNVSHEQIGLLRRRLREEPRNSIVLTEIARLYSLVGQSSQAEKAMKMACAVSPTNRFVLRSASRLFLHVGEPELPLKLLRQNSGIVTRDPWLLAAEVSVSSAAKFGSYYAKTGLKMVDDEKFSDFAKTELTSAIATLEFENGKHRNSKKLFRLSLTSPNENSLAQAQWASRNLPGLDVSIPANPPPRAFEADAYRFFYAQDWEASFSRARCWVQDQPFSTRAVVFATYLCSSILGSYSQAEQISRAALVANPGHPILMNNIAFALANMGRLEQAETEFENIDRERAKSVPYSDIVLLATQGMLHMRRGRLIEGRDLYLEAVVRARKAKIPKYGAIAALNLAREEALAKGERFQETLALAEEESGKVPGEPDVQFLLRRLRLENTSIGEEVNRA